MESGILIWNKDVGFIRINEGTGDNLLPEDEKEGYVDYIMFDMLEYDGLELVETDGGQAMLTELYQEKFKSVEEVIQYMIDDGFIPDAKYLCLFAE